MKFEVAESVESLLHHRLRTLLTLLGMIFGVGAVIAMLSIGKGAEREALQLIDTMGLRNIIIKAKVFEESKLKEIRENSPGLTLQDLNAARETLPFLSTYSANKQVKTYAVFSRAGESDAEVLGVTPTYLEMANLSVGAGRFLLPFDDLVYAHVCVIGSRIAQFLFPGELPLGQQIKINHVWMTVVGVLKDKNLLKDEFQGITLKGEQNNIYVPIQTALKVFRFGDYESDLDEFRVQVKEEISSATAAATLAHLMKRRHKEIDDYEMIVPEALLEQHRKTQNIFSAVWIGT
ncbi:MAG: ABC transporter permease [Candidatus Aminicenantaceae bacterium]